MDPVPSRRHSRIKHSIVCFCFPLLYLSSAKAELIRGSGLWPTHLQSTHHITLAEQHRRLTSGECLYCGCKGHMIFCPAKPKDRARQ